jgi:hypothetical protein
MFIDVHGASELLEALGNARAQAATASLFDIVIKTAEHHEGRIVKTIGSQVMCVFSAVAEAAAAAVAAQRAVQPAIRQLGGSSLALRIGFHHGPVIHQEADVFGDAVNVAARVLSLSKPGQIFLTGDTAKALAGSTADIRVVGSTNVKGKVKPIELVELIWERENLTMANVRPLVTGANARLIVRLGDIVAELGAHRPVLQMGRAESNDLVVPGPLVSRMHARIELRRNSFHLVDQSSNGTFVRPHGQLEMVLRRDEVALSSSGLISLGAPTAEAPDRCLQYSQ